MVFRKSITKSAKATQRLGEILAKEILNRPLGKGPVVLTLQVVLGAGKTCLLQGLAKGLGIKEKIKSPTFIIMRKFKIQNSKFKTFYHFDCYRIQKPKEILDLGLRNIIKNTKNIVAIEWPESIKRVLPRGLVLIQFKLIGKNSRKITILSPK